MNRVIVTGQKVFGINMVQLVLIGVSLGLAIWAQYLSQDLSHLSLSDFISKSFDNIFAENASFSLWLNVVFPFIMYIVACLLLLWMGITNISALVSEESKVDLTLKLLLGVCQVILFGWFLYAGGRLFIYYAAFSILILISIFALIYVFAADDK